MAWNINERERMQSKGLNVLVLYRTQEESREGSETFSFQTRPNLASVGSGTRHSGSPRELIIPALDAGYQIKLTWRYQNSQYSLSKSIMQECERILAERGVAPLGRNTGRQTLSA